MPLWSDLIHVTLSRNYRLLHSFRDYFSKSNAFSKNLIRTKFILIKPHPHLYANAKRIMWTCRQTALTFIRLCGICSANRRTLSVRSRYFKEKYARNHTDVDVYSFGQPTNDQRNAEQATFWHSFAFASVLHSLFVFAYRCGCALKFSFERVYFCAAKPHGCPSI